MLPLLEKRKGPRSEAGGLSQLSFLLYDVYKTGGSNILLIMLFQDPDARLRLLSLDSPDHPDVQVSGKAVQVWK